MINMPLIYKKFYILVLTESDNSKNVIYVKQLKIKKNGFKRLVESNSSSITINAKKYMKSENVV